MHTVMELVEFERLRRLDERAIRSTVILARGVTREDLSRPTPCAGWTLADLLAHMAAQHRGFAAAARGFGADPAQWVVRPRAAEAVGDTEAVGEVGAAGEVEAMGEVGADGAVRVDETVRAAGRDRAVGQVGAVGRDEAVRVAETAGILGEYSAAAERVITAFAALADPDRPFALPEITTARTFPALRAVAFHLTDCVAHSWDIARALDLPHDPDPDLVRAAMPTARAIPDGDSRLAPGSPFGPRLLPGHRASRLEHLLTALGRSPEWRSPAPAAAGGPIRPGAERGTAC
ncbi:maleylpyruvate isomerase N-terminal domain-containing protein [Streptomyces sp. NPDC020141]|uniref:maleylpyruvate isomerase N-terminal domain-containing protein n=1 Tax=Streptomyces sp. NPDC020141 TaxID=3365065 RepID=UPI00379097BB